MQNNSDIISYLPSSESYHNDYYLTDSLSNRLKFQSKDIKPSISQLNQLVIQKKHENNAITINSSVHLSERERHERIKEHLIAILRIQNVAHFNENVQNIDIDNYINDRSSKRLGTLQKMTHKLRNIVLGSRNT